MTYMVLSSREKPLFLKKIFHDTYFFTQFVHSHIRQHYSSKYSGDGCMGRPPTSNFGGTFGCPPSPPLSLHPWSAGSNFLCGHPHEAGPSPICRSPPEPDPTPSVWMS